MEAANLMDGFRSMPVKFSESSTAVRYIFYKTHKVREQNDKKPNNRTLFLANVPAYCNKLCLMKLFTECGKVQQVYFHQEPTSHVLPYDKYKYFRTMIPIKGTKVAYVVFAKESSVQTAMELVIEKPVILSTNTHPLTTGLKRWCIQYNSLIPVESEIDAEVTEFMSEYDAAVAQKAEDLKNQTGVEDDQGWITVTKYGRKPGIPRTEANDAKVENLEKKKRGKRELQNFYSFQIKESKMEHIAQLREKFEEDKNRIALMKASRKFRPY